MTKPGKISYKVKDEAVQLYQNNVGSMEDIAKSLGISTTVVSKAIREYKKKSGLPVWTTTRKSKVSKQLAEQIRHYYFGLGYTQAETAKRFNIDTSTVHAYTRGVYRDRYTERESSVTQYSKYRKTSHKEVEETIPSKSEEIIPSKSEKSTKVSSKTFDNYWQDIINCSDSKLQDKMLDILQLAINKGWVE